MNSISFLKRYRPRFTTFGTLLASALSGMVVGGLLHVLVTQPRLSEAQGTVRDMVQNARIAIEVMSRELRMAGYNPQGASFDGITYAPGQLHIRADLNGDGNTDGPNEDIRYTYDAATQQIIRVDRAGQEPLAEHLHAFTLTCLDKDGQPTTVSAHIRHIRLTVTTRAAGVGALVPTPPSTYTLTTLVNVRNVSAVTEHGQS